MELFVRRFSACVFDMDGTLCTSRGHPDGHDRVTGATAAALLKYYASGGRVIVATGRPPAAATCVIDRDLPAGVVSLVVCCDGGCILARAATAAGGEWQPVWEAGLSGGCTLRLLRDIEQRNPQRCHFGVQLHEGFDGFGVYGSVVSSTRVQELLEAAHPQWGSFIRNMVPSGLRTPAQMAERLPRVLSREALDAKLAGTAAVGWVRVVRDEVDGGDSEQRDLACWLQPLLEAENSRGDCGPVELVSEHLACSSTAFIRKAGTDKAVALAVAEELLCISAGNICVFGDGSNDLGMFGWAGYAVAPANALPKVKSSANYVSQLSNDENFIADFFSRPAPSNTVEGKVAPYSLPDPLRCADGSLVTRADQWPARRAEIMEVFRSQVYGRLPAVEVTTGSAVADASAIVAEYSVVRREDGVLGGLGSRVEGMMQFSRHFGSTTVVRRVPVLMFLPASAASSGTKAPVFCGLNFSGNHTVHPDPGITRSTVLEDPPILPAHRGAQASLWQVELLLTRGFGILTIYSGDISSDTNNNRMPRDSPTNQTPAQVLRSGCHALFIEPPTATDALQVPVAAPAINGNKRQFQWQTGEEAQEEGYWTQSESCGSIGIWAWGLCRAIDFLQSVSSCTLAGDGGRSGSGLTAQVDMGKLAVIGHSRKGKTALWAAAQDPRFSLVVSNNSGTGGAALSRRDFGESVEQITWRFPTWFCPGFRRHANELAVDQHCLLAAIAPRPLYVASAEDDLHCDPRGEFESIRAADPVYTLLLRATNDNDTDDDDNDDNNDDDDDAAAVYGAMQDNAAAMATAFYDISGQHCAGAAQVAELAEGPVNVPVGGVGGRLRYHRRSGGHDVTRYDWEQYLTFAEEHFGMGRKMATARL